MEVPSATSSEEKVFVDVRQRARICLDECRLSLGSQSTWESDTYPKTKTM